MADDDALQIQHIYRIDQGHGQLFGDVGEHGFRRRNFGIAGKVLGQNRMSQRFFKACGDHGNVGINLQTPPVSAVADRSFALDAHVTDFTHGFAAQFTGMPVENNAGSDSIGNAHIHEAVRHPPDTVKMLGNCGGVHIIFKINRKMVSVHQQFCHRIIGDAVKVCRVQDHAGGGIQRADSGYADAEKFSFGKRFGGESESLVAKAEDFFFKRAFGFVFQGNAFGKQTVQPEGADNDRQLVSGDIKAQGNRRLSGDFKKGRCPANARSTFAFSFNDIPVLDQLPHDFGDCHPLPTGD